MQRLILILAFFFGAVPFSVSAQSLPLQKGTYSCYTITTQYTNPDTQIDPVAVLRKQSDVKVRPMTVPQIFMAPAAFGNVILDGKGKYTMPQTKQSGSYSFDASTGRPRFTGDLGAMKLLDYNGTGTSFNVGWQGMNFNCGLPVGPSKPVNAGSQAPNIAITSYAGTMVGTAKASDFNGYYEGSYYCSSIATFMRLNLDAKPDGTIDGVMQFGGVKTPEIDYSLGSYALKGTWKGSHYVLKADHWIKEPVGYVMVDLEGDLMTLGTAGRVLYSSCDSFAVRRALP